MAGRRPAEAVRNFLEPLQLAASCITDSIFRPSVDGYREGVGHGLALNKGEPVRLGHGLMLSAQLEYDVIKLEDPPPEAAGPYKVRTRAYRYHLMTEDLTEVLLWHWHPSGASSYTDPHLHVSQTQLNSSAVIYGVKHHATGRMAFEQVLLQLLGELGIEARRNDWEDRLNETLERFARWRTWT